MQPTTVWLLFVAAASMAAQSPQGGVRSYTAGSEPACNAATRGQVVVSLGAEGEPDLLKLCGRDGVGRYAWVPAGQGNPNTFKNSRRIGGCPLFPDNNVWNSPADSLPVDAGSAAIITTYAAARVGVDPSMSINLADGKTPVRPMQFSSVESDFGLYPITPGMKVEGYAFNKTFPVSGGPYPTDAHLLVLRTDECKLYEIFALRTTQPPYAGGSGAIFDLLSNSLRPDGWTSADAAGLPIWPGVLTYEEVFGAGEIRHMIRFTVGKTRNSYVWPARHNASRSRELSLPPMGSRWRLKASFDENTCNAGDRAGGAFPPQARKIIRALKRYGMILSDNGAAILLTADADPRWGDPSAGDSPTAMINGWTHCIVGQDFEVVNSSSLMVNPNSAEVAQ